MTLREAIECVESFMDAEVQSGRLDDETVEALDFILARAELEAVIGDIAESVQA